MDDRVSIAAHRNISFAADEVRAWRLDELD
jgi:hypothetical protein